MNRISIKEFVKKIKLFNKVHDLIEDGKIDPNNIDDISELRFTSVANVHEILKYINLTASDTQFNFNTGGVKYNHYYYEKESHLQYLAKDTHADYSSIQFFPNRDNPDFFKYTPRVIHRAPNELLENEQTYRMLTCYENNYKNRYYAQTVISLCTRHDEAIYDYLDLGNLVMELPSEEDKQRGKIIVSRVYNTDTAHIFAMCALQPALTSYLHQDAIIREEDASLVKLRMLKNLSDTNKEIYKTISRDFDRDYEEATKSLVVTKLVKGEIQKTTINDIVFTTTTATYESISVEAEDLLSVLQTGLNFSGEFDIYRVIDVLVAKYVLRLNASFTETKPLHLKINNMPLYLKTSSKSGHNFINNIRINQDEVRRVLTRASCYQSVEQYTLFLKSVRKMSLKMHDVLANGVAVKFHPDQTYSEYNTSEPRENAPALNFVFDSTDKKVKLKISDSRSVKINIARFLRLVETLNAKTDNRLIRGGWTKSSYRRDYSWCAAQLVKIIKKCCTVMTEVKREDGTSYMLEDVLIQKEDILSILERSKSDKLKAIEKSKEFLDIAVKCVGAEKITFRGETAYKVKGALRTYAVVVSSAKVFDFDTQKYRCIINSSHYKGTGFDDVASRLLALKNDSVMQNSINTLAGEAYNYEPEVGPANPAHRNPIALYEGIVGTTIENEFGK